jgi:Leucine-rich repeat (LRR) protein
MQEQSQHRCGNYRLQIIFTKLKLCASIFVCAVMLSSALVSVVACSNQSNGSVSSDGFISFADRNLEACIKKDLRKLNNEKISQNEAESISTIACTEEGVSTLQDVQYFVNVRSILLRGNQIGSVENDAFSNLPFLKLLDLRQNQLRELSNTIFSGLPLEILYLSENQLRNLPKGIFQGLPLVHLDLSGNELFPLPEGIFSGLRLDGSPMTYSQFEYQIAIMLDDSHWTILYPDDYIKDTITKYEEFLGLSSR